jgi:nucleotide-binding universal stress UspA family protein
MNTAQSALKKTAMLKLLIPVICQAGALEAARHAAFLFAQKCVAHVEVIEILDDPAESRAVAFHSRSALRRQEKQLMREALTKTCAVLEDAGVPYTWRRIFGSAEKSIADHANRGADVVVLDASCIGLLRRWLMLVRLWRLTRKPLTVLH